MSHVDANPVVNFSMSYGNLKPHTGTLFTTPLRDAGLLRSMPRLAAGGRH
jgi:hypothetical protein